MTRRMGDDGWLCEHEELEDVCRICEAERRIAELEAVLRELSEWDRKPWTDMVDSDEQQLHDVRHALKMACVRARDALTK